MVTTRGGSESKVKSKTGVMRKKTISTKVPKNAKGKSTVEGPSARSPVSLNKRHADEINRILKKQKGISITEPKDTPFKLWQFKVKHEDRLHSKIDMCMSYNVINEIKSILNERELEMFRNSCFGYFLDIPKFKVQNQILHCLLLREVEQLNKFEMWFEIGGHRLRFGMQEFALVSGLKCQGDSNKYAFEKISNGLIDKYFKGLKSVSRQTLNDLFMSKRWESEVDGFKIGFMHFLHNFLLASPMPVHIPLKDFDIVDSDKLNDYPWGIDVFKYTFECLATKCVLSPTSLKKIQDEEGKYFYRVTGFPYALLCWFYECCPSAKNTFVQLVNATAIPRILRWQSSFFPKFNQVDRELFVDIPSDEVKFRSIIPTPAERNTLQLGDFFKRNKGKGKATDDAMVSEEDGSEEGYCSAFVISNDGDSMSKKSELHTMEEKIDFLMVGQKKMEADFVDFKRFFTSKFSEVLTVVNSLKTKIDATCDSNKVDRDGDSENNISSSGNGNANGHDIPYSGDENAESEDSMDAEKTVSDNNSPILKFKSKQQEASTSVHTSSVVKEETVELPADESSKKDSINASFHGSDRGIEESAEAQKVTPEKEIDDKAIPSDENDEAEPSAKADEKDEKVDDVDPVDDKDGNSEKDDDVDPCIPVSTDRGEDVVEEKMDIMPSAEDNDVPNVGNIEAAATNAFAGDYKAVGVSKDVGASVGVFSGDYEAVGGSKDVGATAGVSSAIEVQGQSQVILNSPTCDLTNELIDEVINNARKSIAELKSTEVDYIEANFGIDSINPDLVTPVPSKRVIKPSFFLKSPFLNEFGSSLGCIVPKQNISIIRICPFHENGSTFCDVTKQEAFRKWLDQGINKKLKKKIYDDKNAILFPRLSLGVIEIEQKSWLYSLYHCGQPISNSHVDVLFYYLRKKVKVGPVAMSRCTSTDNFFDQRIQAMYALYSKKQDATIVSSKNAVADYINGGYMRCNTKWADVDDVLFPINCGKEWHWILARLNFKERCIYVYNSLRSARRDKSINEYVECYSVLLPLFFEVVKLFDSRDDIDTTTGPYEGKRFSDPFRIEIVENLPVQTDLDCGVHMFCAAELFVDGKVMGDDFNISRHRARYACSLYTYGVWKEDSLVMSDDEAPVKIKRV